MQQTTNENTAVAPVMFETDEQEQCFERPTTHKWTKDEYYKLFDLGFFDGKRVELIEGEIIEMAAMKSPHITCVMILGEVLREVFGDNFYVRTQGAMDFGKDSQPEPDAAVVKGKIRDYVKGHPRKAVLLVEVADTTIYKDRNFKAKLYAKNDVRDYWILNLNKRCLEVYRQPKKDKNLGYIYTESRIYTEDDTVSPLAAPEAKIKVADLLP
jgi:Uma2 family endonuclease